MTDRHEGLRERIERHLSQPTPPEPYLTAFIGDSAALLRECLVALEPAMQHNQIATDTTSESNCSGNCGRVVDDAGKQVHSAPCPMAEPAAPQPGPVVPPNTYWVVPEWVTRPQPTADDVVRAVRPTMEELIDAVDEAMGTENLTPGEASLAAERAIRKCFRAAGR